MWTRRDTVMGALARSGVVCALLAAPGAARAAIIDFGAAPAGVTPFSLPLGNVTARFSAAADPAAFAVVPTRFATLGDQILQDAGFTPSALTIQFSAPVPDFSAAFATDDAGLATPLLLTAYRGGDVVGEARASGTVPAGFFYPEGAIGFSGSLFDRVVLDAGAAAFAVGRIEVTGSRTDIPEPGTTGLLGAGVLALGLARRRAVRAGAAALLALAAAPSDAAAQLSLRTKVTTAQEMVVTANPLATEAGARVLRDGGNAMDAATAVQAVLGLVEPQSTGVGGGGFILYYDAAARRVTSYDARETAPAAATGSYFLDAAGAPLPFAAAQLSGRSVGVPGIPALWETVQARHGTRTLAAVLQPAIQLASAGFPISPRMAGAIDGAKVSLATDANARAYFLNPDGTGKPAGTVLQNPAYAGVLARIAWAGARAFYQGPIALGIVDAVVGDPRPGGPGAMTLADLANYRVIERTPVCGEYRAYVVCGMGPPSSGGVATLQILGVLNQFDLAALGPDSVQTVHLFLQANRLAFADRNVYLADPDRVAVPTAGLVDPAYLASRAALVGPGPLAPGLAPAGVPAGAGGAATTDVSPPRFGGTSHVSIADRFGNVVSMTTTVESGFGNNRMVSGFLLNNELTDFSFDPGPAGAPVANRVEGGKRPRSSMAPTVVFTRDGRPAFVAGSPGGASIIGTTTQALVAMIDHGLDPQQAANQAHYQNNNTGATTLESLFGANPPGPPTGLIGPFDVRSLAPALTALGYTIPPAPSVLTSGLSLIRFTPEGIEGGADPRREGVAAGR